MFLKSHSKLIRSLHSKKMRWERKLFIVENPKVLREFISENFEVMFLFTLRDGFYENHPKSILLSNEQLKKHSSLDNPQECIAILKMKSFKPHSNSWSIILDRVQDPGNAGALIRLADWFGLDWMAIPPGTVDPYSPKVVQASMGSLARLPLIFESDSNLDILLRKENRIIVLADMKGISPKDALESKKGCLILGNEGNGPSDFWKSRCDHFVSIQKSPRSKTESLNVATAAAILLYEISN